MEELDIKTISPYIVDKTTHVVQSKRNTAKGLQALVNGTWIVDESYVDALVYAATPSDLENLESLSPLEADFDTAWPDPSLHLPPPGKEPVHRPPEAFAPNPNRINLFDGYTFVFGEPAQYENISDAINNGHGKALLYQVEPGVTTAEEIVQFMGNAAGDKGLGAERHDPGGVVFVRFRSKGHYEGWSIDISNQVAIMTDQRVIEQREFLDAILANDASSLCRPLPPDPDSCSAAEPTSQTTSQPAPAPIENIEPPVSQAPESAAQAPEAPEAPEEPSQLPKAKSKAPRVRGFVSKMKTFDDGFDLASIPAYGPEDDSRPTPGMDLEPLSEPASQQPTQRAAQQPSQAKSGLDEEQEQEVEEEDVMSGLLPGTNAMKRRRAETGPRHDPPTSKPKQEVVEQKPKRQKLDVLEAARQHREAEEDAQRRQEENDIKDMDIEKLKGLAIVEEMDVPLRERQPQAIPDNDERWDDRWNGRKNFKKFRRKGEARHPRTRVQAVIVPLEEVTRKDFGIGDHYWVSNGNGASLETSNSPAESRPRGSLRREESNINDILEDSGGRGGPTPQSRSQSAARVVESEAPAEARHRSQKRPREVRDSDSEDELRFRFRRRR